MSESTPFGHIFRFGLRTLFVGVMVIALALGWVAREYRSVQNRKATLKAIQEKGWHARTLDPSYPPDAKLVQCKVPLIRRWMGDEPISEIAFAFDTPNAELRAWLAPFPEVVRINFSRSTENIGSQPVDATLPDTLVRIMHASGETGTPAMIGRADEFELGPPSVP